MIRTLAAGVATLLLWSGAAQAASFDCGKASSPFEKAVCSDPVLSKTDDALAELYRKDLALLSASGRSALQQSERSWLAYARTLCRPGETPLNPVFWSYPGEDDSNAALVDRCFANAYERRRTALGKAAVRLAGRTFLQTTTYKVRAARLPEGTQGPDAAHWIATAVRIDAPKMPSEAAWNAAAADALDDVLADPGGDTPLAGASDDGTADGDFTAEVVSATPDFVDYQVIRGVYQKGMAHPDGSSESHLYSLRLGRDLIAKDIFKPSDAWREALTTATFARLPAEWRKPDYKEAITSGALNLSHWAFLPSGVQIRFNPYSVAGYIPPDPLIVPWADLKPYLRSDLPFRIGELQAAPS